MEKKKENSNKISETLLEIDWTIFRIITSQWFLPNNSLDYFQISLQSKNVQIIFYSFVIDVISCWVKLRSCNPNQSSKAKCTKSRSLAPVVSNDCIWTQLHIHIQIRPYTTVINIERFIFEYQFIE